MCAGVLQCLCLRQLRLLERCLLLARLQSCQVDTPVLSTQLVIRSCVVVGARSIRSRRDPGDLHVVVGVPTRRLKLCVARQAYFLLSGLQASLSHPMRLLDQASCLWNVKGICVTRPLIRVPQNCVRVCEALDCLRVSCAPVALHSLRSSLLISGLLSISDRRSAVSRGCSAAYHAADTQLPLSSYIAASSSRC